MYLRCVVTTLLAGWVLLSETNAQESEVEMPASETTVGVGVIGEDGKLAVQIGARSHTVPVTRMMEQSYTVMVPYTVEEEKDGKKVKVTKTRAETRTRTVPVTSMKLVNHFDHEMDDLKFYRIDGEEVSQEEAEEHFATKQPIVTITSGAEITDFFELVFRDDVMVVELPPGQTRALPGGVARPIPRVRINPRRKRGEDK